MANSINEWKHNLHVLWFNDFIIGMGFQISMPFVALYVKQLGHFNHFQLSFWSGLAFSASFFVSSWMAPIWGKIADRHGRKKVLMLSATGMGIFSVLMGIALNVYELVTFRLLQGFFSGYVANTSALIASSVPKDFKYISDRNHFWHAAWPVNWWIYCGDLWLSYFLYAYWIRLFNCPIIYNIFGS